MAELKPCPFCGSSEIIAEVNQIDKRFYVLCGECVAEMNLSFVDAQIGDGKIVSFHEMHEIMKQMIEAWNRRAEE